MMLRTIGHCLLEKAGFPGALGLLALLPLVNLIMFFFLAFSDWPVPKEFKTLRHNHHRRCSVGVGSRNGVVL
jgi:hypothetical protein